MTMRLMCAAGLLALAGCGASEDGAEGNAAKGAGAGAGAGAAAAKGEQIVEIRPGEWEVTVEIPTEGMPPEIVAAMDGGKVTSRQCITPDKARASTADLFSSEQAGDCTASNVSAGNGKMRGTMTCSGQDGGPVSVEIEGSYGPESYEMTQHMTMPGGQKSEMRIAGRRVGECAAGAVDVPQIPAEG